MSLSLAHSSDAIIVGGGYKVSASQGQIELNTQWVQQLLIQNGMNVTTFYTDGDDPGPDVNYLKLPEDYDSPLEPLARVFDNYELDRSVYRNHLIEQVSGSTERELLLPQLNALLGPDNTEDTLFVYNGHGTQSLSTPDKVSLHLWDDTKMQARELHEILEQSTAPFRFVMTQCYSGGFHRLAYENPASGVELAEGPARCGFTAESAYHLSEGCSSSIDTSDYRDYTTFFFAGLSGVDRQGEPVQSRADLDDDGSVTLREAHLYTLANGMSADLSRSTSEDYLDTWQPWYLRWAPADAVPTDSEYTTLFNQLAARLSLDAGSKNITTSIASRLQSLFEERATLVGEQTQLLKDKQNLQKQLQTTLLDRWPEMAGPYTSSFAELAERGILREAASYISEQSDYKTLVKLQEMSVSQQELILENERAMTQMQKMQRLRRLAMLQRQLGQYGSTQQQEDYASLVTCEESSLD